MDYEETGRFLPTSVSFSNPPYHERNAPLVLAHTGRANSRTWPMGDLGGSLYSRVNMGGEDSMEAGPARRRIAVACARCRKRKIRCSGDLGNGSGCTSCRQAGLAPMQCQFHRVGSDNVHKVIDNISVAHSLTSMANANGMMPVYSRSSPIQQFSELSTKPTYHNTWSVPYSEDTSPVDTYGLEHSPTYLQNPASITDNNLYESSCRWTHPVPKPLPNAYFEQEPTYTAHSLPYLQTNFQGPTNDAVSPLNMSFLRLTLPTKPHPQQHHFSEAIAPQRQLPMPQPSPAQAPRNVVDRLQDQRLRSVQGIGATNSNTGGPFFKPFLPWGGGGDNPNNTHEAASSSCQTDTTDYITYSSSTNNDAKVAVAEPQPELNFTTSTLTEAMNAPVSATAPYSHFRKSRPHPPMPTQMLRQGSQTSSYSYSADHTSKHNSLGRESANSCKLVSGQLYEPLAQSGLQNTSSTGNKNQESFQNQRILVHPA